MGIEFLNRLRRARTVRERRRGRLLFLGLLLLVSLITAGGKAAASNKPAWRDWVLKIEVVRSDGRKETGSGVLIAPERLLTNCHVVRRAKQITAFQGQASWSASVDIGDSYRDLCLLRLPGHPGTPPAIAESKKVRVGQTVYAAGYSGGTFAVDRGQIRALYSCRCGDAGDAARVIQTSAQFSPGASGGGLFNADGELVGILTFKSHEGGIFHFAIPVDWMKALSAATLDGLGPFWASPSTAHGYFLAACDLSAHKKWRELSRLTREWVREEPSNPEAWMASGRAKLGLKRPREAAADFQKALGLDPGHGEALRELQELEFELGESLTGG